MTDTAARKKRTDIALSDTWDIASVFADDAAWEAEFARVELSIPDLAARAGTLGTSAQALCDTLVARDAVNEPLERLNVYASMVHDVDTADPRGQALQSRIEGLWARFGAATAFVAPEMLQIAPDTLTAWRDSHPGLAPYRRAIDETLRLRDHVRSTEVEAVLAEMSEVRGAPSDIAGLLRNADLTFPAIRDESGKKIKLSEGLYRVLLESKNRRVRRAAYHGILSSYARYRNTLGASLARNVKGDVADARVRRYATAVESSLTPRDIPIAVYRNLVTTCRAHLSTLHRYLRLHRRALGVRNLHPYDLFVSIVPEHAADGYSFGRAVDTVVESVRPLGVEYGEVARRGLIDHRWADVFENEGKRSGAYSGGSYGTAPFMLLNFRGTEDDVFTLTHELGHSMHSWLTRKHQPYPTGDYPIFLAEVASTFNEELLRDHLLSRANGDRARQAALLGSALDDFRGTFFRQTLFAEFELAIHDKVEKGEALTAETMTEIYQRLNEEYYGAVVTIDPVVWTEWARIPHFYFAFYVYQYATGLVAATALAQMVLEGAPGAVDRYLTFLKSGSSADPLTILRRAGIDMTTPEPIERALAVFSDRTDRLAALLGH
ncbi:MAG: oligoendopeptidase F [Chloroflexota bacterium]|nr:MAG: oligoendopeptidase F [Chloroflexota bacterium]